FGGACEATSDGDPIVVYDKQVNRWVIHRLLFSRELRFFNSWRAWLLTMPPARIIATRFPSILSRITRSWMFGQTRTTFPSTCFRASSVGLSVGKCAPWIVRR